MYVYDVDVMSAVLFLMDGNLLKCLFYHHRTNMESMVDLNFCMCSI